MPRPPRIIGRAAVVGVLLSAGVAHAAETEPAATATVASARTKVEIYVMGQLAEADRAELLRVIKAQLGPTTLELAEVQPEQAAGQGWLGSTHNPSVLMRVSLDVTRPAAWRLEIGDAARGRRLLRELPGERGNAAAAEAVANVVTAAALALHEGFELADEGAPKPKPAEPKPAPQPAPPRQPRAPAPVRVLSDLAIEMASLASGKAPQLGATAALGVRIVDRFSARLGAAQYFPARVASSLGDFRLERRALSVSLGATLLPRPAELELDLGAGVELFERVAASPASGVAATNDSDRARFGVVGGLRARYRFISVLALEARLGGAYYPTPLRYVAQPSSEGPLLEAWPWVLQGSVGFELSAP